MSRACLYEVSVLGCYVWVYIQLHLHSGFQEKRITRIELNIVLAVQDELSQLFHLVLCSFHSRFAHIIEERLLVSGSELRRYFLHFSHRVSGLLAVAQTSNVHTSNKVSEIAFVLMGKLQ